MAADPAATRTGSRPARAARRKPYQQGGSRIAASHAPIDRKLRVDMLVGTDSSPNQLDGGRWSRTTWGALLRCSGGRSARRSRTIGVVRSTRRVAAPQGRSSPASASRRRSSRWPRVGTCACGCHSQAPLQALAHLTDQQLAERTNISRSQISPIRRGLTRQPHPRHQPESDRPARLRNATQDAQPPQFECERGTEMTSSSGPTQVDFFISYTQSDRVWAEWIGWELEQAGYTTMVQSWDFRAERAPRRH